MTRKLSLLVAFVIGAAVAGCAGPCVMFPGGALAGDAAPTPDGWAFTDDVSTIQLETRPAEPYSVNIWVTALRGSLYVHAGANRAEWVDHMEADSNVRLRIGDAIYSLVAARVDAQEEFDQFADAYELKYGNRPRNENVAEAYLFRLAGRQTQENES